MFVFFGERSIGQEIFYEEMNKITLEDIWNAKPRATCLPAKMIEYREYITRRIS